jgi:uncharacterized protein (DUF2267 family)
LRAEDFYQCVAEHLRTDRDRAKQITLCALESLNHRLTQEVAEELAAQLPRDMEHRLQSAEYDASWDKQLFMAPLICLADSERLLNEKHSDHNDPQRHDVVVQQIQGVFSAIKRCVQPSTVKHLTASLPPEVDQWFMDAPLS